MPDLALGFHDFVTCGECLRQGLPSHPTTWTKCSTETQLPEILTERALKNPIQKECRGLTVSSAAKSLLLKAWGRRAYEWLLPRMRNLLEQHCDRKTIQMKDIDPVRVLSDKAELTKHLRCISLNPEPTLNP